MAIKKSGLGDDPSFSSRYLENRDSTPQVSAIMAQGVSEQRRALLSNEVEQGHFRDGSGPTYSAISKENAETANGRVISSFSKLGQMGGGGGGGMFGANVAGNSVKQMPEVYSPLWLNSNLNLPRDRATINAWCRSFFALNPFVHNAISLHSTYPISKLSIKCPNKEIEKFFDDMIEEIDLMNICVQIAQEYWLIGEAFIYAELDEGKGKWNRLMIQNPDFMIVKRTVVASEPIIELRPDENLKKIIMSNRPNDIEQRKQLNSHIIDSVRRGNNIPLDNFSVSHLARRISPYEIRGTGLPVCIFRQLMLFDKLRECYSDDTEVLTDQGFKKIADLVHTTSQIALSPNYINGIELDEEGQIASVLTMKEDFKVACIDPLTNNVEYHKPIELHMSKYTGEMIHFTGKKVDCLVSPNHKMWVKEKTNGKWSNFEKRTAISLLDKKKNYKFSAIAHFTNSYKPTEIEVCGHMIPIDTYLKVLGYMVSEGCVYQNFDNGRYDALISTSQFTDSDCYQDMRGVFSLFANKMDKNCSHYVNMVDTGYRTKNGIMKEKWSASIHGKDISTYFKETIGVDGNTKSHFKHLPRWVFDLTPELMSILLEALVNGDGSEATSKYGTDSKSFRYSTVSKQLADDVYELVYKLGFVPNICISDKIVEEDRRVVEYIVLWSDTNYGNEPNVMSTTKIGNNGGGARINKVNYDGIVWCFEVPTGLFITRRNGKITVQGNSKYAQADGMVNPLTIVKIGSENYKPTYADLEAWRSTFEQLQYDKDMKIFTHEGVSVERVGYGQGIYDISGDITQLMKEIFIGLQVPPIIMDGTDTPYASAGVALDILRQRYMEFRNMLSHWLKTKIFAPISKIQQFYDYTGGEKKLIVPEIDWNHMSLFDAGDYITTLVQLTQGEGAQKRVSLSTLYRSLGLEEEDENRKMRKENIQNAIAAKEVAALEKMSLNALRALDDEDEIPEPEEGDVQEQPVPGETPGGAPGGLPDLGTPSMSVPPMSGGGGSPAGPPSTPPPTEGPASTGGGNAPPAP